MIEYLHGEILRTTPEGAIISNSGLGYGVNLPESMRREISNGDSIKVFIHTYVREDILRLYGFRTWEDKELFALLLSIQNIGPSIAVPMVDVIGASELLAAAQTESTEALKNVKGIGPKKSKRILIDVKTKLENRPDLLGNASTLRRPMNKVEGAQHAAPFHKDLSSALANLGYREKEYLPVLDTLLVEHAAANLETLLRMALRELAGGGVHNQTSMFTDRDL